MAPITAVVPQVSVKTMRDDLGRQVFVGSVHHPVGETDAEEVAAWDFFASRMFAYGVEPVSDEPATQQLLDGRVVDFYQLQKIVEDDL